MKNEKPLVIISIILTLLLIYCIVYSIIQPTIKDNTRDTITQDTISSVLDNDSTAPSAEQTKMQIKESKITVNDAHKFPVIGNIYLGISSNEFQKQLKIFYNKYSTINNLNVDEIIPIFVNNKLERIIIYSKKHLQNRNNWLSLYKSKYKNIIEDGIIIKNGIRIYINDNVFIKFYLNKFVFENTEEYKNWIYNEQKFKDNDYLSLDIGDFNDESEEEKNKKLDLKLPKRYSIIDIRNEVLYNQVLNNYNKSYNNNFKKSYNAI